MSNFSDVEDFSRKMGLPMPERPQLLDEETADFRIRFMQEELKEFILAHAEGDLTEAADGLIDLAYVVMGTAVMMGLPWEELWDEVQRTNMKKRRGTTDRSAKLDCIKPPGWKPPDLESILRRASRR